MLPRALQMFPEPALVWLDAHWSKDLGYTRYDEVVCPVLEELEILAKDGDRDNGQIVGELTLEFLAERANVMRSGYAYTG